MKEFFTARLVRKRYFIYFSALAIAWILATFVGAGFSYSRQADVLEGYVVIKLLQMPLYFLSIVFMMRRYMDITGEKVPLLGVLMVATGVALITTFIDAWSPKYVLIGQIIIGFVPVKNEKNDKIV